MDPRLYVTGISHHATPLAVREQISLSPQEALDLASSISDGEYLPVPLATCNRVELYGLDTRGAVVEEFLSALARIKQVDPGEIRPFVYHRYNHEMIFHLFSVASGIDSQMIGETEILGQVKDAWRRTRNAGPLADALDPVFQKAFQAAKWARTQTGIGSGQVSIGNIAVELAGRIFGSLGPVRVLLVGSGEVAELVASALAARGATNLRVTGRNELRTADLAARIGARVFPFAGFTGHLRDFDIVLFSTSSPTPLLGPDSSSCLRRASGPLFLIDLALPRDVDPSVGHADEVFLYNLDDLSRIANENLEARRVDIERCREELTRRAWQTWLRAYRVILRSRPGPAPTGSGVPLTTGRESN